MSYFTTFEGEMVFNTPLSDELRDYVNTFARSRHMKRDCDRIRSADPEWEEHCLHGQLREDGQYYIGKNDMSDPTVVNYNAPPNGCPGLWSDWVVDSDTLKWDEDMTFYHAKEWLKYYIDHFFAPAGYKLNGQILWKGEESGDRGKIVVTDNVVDIYEPSGNPITIPTEDGGLQTTERWIHTRM